METLSIQSVEEFVATVQRLESHWRVKDRRPALWFRGHADLDWKLLPGLQRFPLVDPAAQESSAYYYFQVRAPQLLRWVPDEHDAWSWMVHMQHYGFPTRLLDWSERPLVALFFALYTLHGDADAVVWVLAPEMWNLAFHAQDNIEMAPGDIRHKTWVNGYLHAVATSETGPLDDEALERRERDCGPPMAVLAPQRNMRIYSQSGTFTVHGFDPRPLDEISDEAEFQGLVRLVIGGDVKATIRQHMLRNWIDETAVFPEAPSLCQKMVREFLVDWKGDGR